MWLLFLNKIKVETQQVETKEYLLQLLSFSLRLNFWILVMFVFSAFLAVLFTSIMVLKLRGENFDFRVLFDRTVFFALHLD